MTRDYINIILTHNQAETEFRAISMEADSYMVSGSGYGYWIAINRLQENIGFMGDRLDCRIVNFDSLSEQVQEQEIREAHRRAYQTERIRRELPNFRRAMVNRAKRGKES